MGLYQFDANNFVITCGGLAITGFASNMITIEANADLWNEEIGTNGDVVRVRANDSSANITLRLLYASPGNTVLNNFKKQDIFNSGAGSFQFAAVDKLNPDIKYISANCYIKKEPSFSADNTIREWMLKAPYMVFDTTGGIRLV